MSYNDWENRETWLAACWMKEDACYRYFVERGAELQSPVELGKRMKEICQCQADAYLPDHGLVRDLVTQGLSRINWLEVARRFAEDMDGLNKSA